MEAPGVAALSLGTVCPWGQKCANVLSLEEAKVVTRFL